MSPVCHQSIQRPPTTSPVELADGRLEPVIRLSRVLPPRHRWTLGVAVLGGYLAVATANAAARPAQTTPAASAPAPTTLVSARYQGENADTAAEIGPVSFRGATSGPAVAGPASEAAEKTAVRPVMGDSTGPRLARPTVVHRQPAARGSTLPWYAASALQYQLRDAISPTADNHLRHATRPILPSAAQAKPSAGSGTLLTISDRTTVQPLPTARSKSAPTSPSTHPAVGSQGADAQATDGRLLLQIALAFGLLYVLFLVFWFWGTRGRARDRARRVGGAARF
jgi:hypothetical protein